MAKAGVGHIDIWRQRKGSVIVESTSGEMYGANIFKGQFSTDGNGGSSS